MVFSASQPAAPLTEAPPTVIAQGATPFVDQNKPVVSADSTAPVHRSRFQQVGAAIVAARKASDFAPAQQADASASATPAPETTTAASAPAAITTPAPPAPSVAIAAPALNPNAQEAPMARTPMPGTRLFFPRKPGGKEGDAVTLPADKANELAQCISTQATKAGVPPEQISPLGSYRGGMHVTNEPIMPRSMGTRYRDEHGRGTSLDNVDCPPNPGASPQQGGEPTRSVFDCRVRQATLLAADNLQRVMIEPGALRDLRAAGHRTPAAICTRSGGM